MMKRRNFIKNSATALSSFGLPLAAIATELPQNEPHHFKLNYAAHFGMFENHAGKDVIEQLKFMSSVGINAIEDNEMRKRPIAEQEKIASEMTRLGMKMGVFVANDIDWNNATLATGKKEFLDKFLKNISDSIEVAKRVNAKWMTVVPDCLDKKLHIEYQTAHVMDALKRAAALLEPHGLVMVLEPLNPYKDHPNLFLSRSSQAYMLCKAVGSPSCKILFDMYHQQITEGNLIPNITACWDEIAYFQIGDNPGRKEPTTGEINYKNLFKFIHSKGYTGILGMEHGNSIAGKEGELALIEAYKYSDSYP